MSQIKCPKCGKEISNQEKKCPYCQSQFDASKPDAEEESNSYTPKMPFKPSPVSSIVSIILTVSLFILWVWVYQDPVLGVIFIILTIVTIIIVRFYFNERFEYNLAHTDYPRYKALREERLERLAELKDKLEKRREEEENQKFNNYKYKCPMCGSNRIGNISTLSKAASIELFGVASKKLGKCYYCDDCKYMW